MVKVGWLIQNEFVWKESVEFISSDSSNCTDMQLFKELFVQGQTNYEN